MKIIILLIAISQIISLRIPETKEVKKEKVQIIKSGDIYYVFDPVWYKYEPVYYIFEDEIYYYWDYWYLPSYWVAMRRDATASASQKTQTEKTFKKEEAKSELSSLKKEIWGKDDFNTDEIRKTQKVYDPRWLMAQLKIARALNLEDMLKGDHKKSSRTESSDLNKNDKKTEIQKSSTEVAKKPASQEGQVLEKAKVNIDEDLSKKAKKDTPKTQPSQGAQTQQ